MLILARKILLLLFTSILCVGAASADAMAADASTIDALIARLGADKYAEREQASRQIVAVGISARGALVKALNHVDAEIAQRARAALLTVIEADFQNRLARFAIDDDPQNDHGFSGWTRFKRIVGSDNMARVLFVEMQRAEAVLLEVAEQSPDKTADAMIVRSVRLGGDHRPRYDEYGEDDVSVASVAALLFLGGDAQLAVADRARAKVYPLLDDGFSDEVRGGRNMAPLKKLLGAWLTRSSGGPQAMQDMWISLRYEIPEGIKPALAILADGGFEQQSRTREYALLVVAKFGDRSHLGAIEPLLSDTSSSDSGAPFRKSARAEVRDVALATMIHLSGQKLKKFGFEKASEKFFDEYDVDSLGFSTNAKRQAALTKWRSWRKSQEAKK